jgi:hypothetical protein
MEPSRDGRPDQEIEVDEHLTGREYSRRKASIEGGGHASVSRDISVNTPATTF